jgi:hypothetical protein
LLSHTAGYLAELVTEFRREHDHGLRCWLLELIGAARSPEALPLLAEQAGGDDELLRHPLRRPAMTITPTCRVHDPPLAVSVPCCRAMGEKGRG